MKFFSKSIDKLIEEYENKKKTIKQKLQHLRFKKMLSQTKEMNNIIFFTDNHRYRTEFSKYMYKRGYLKFKKTIYLLTIGIEYNDIYMADNYIYQDLKTVLINIQKTIEHPELDKIIKHMDNYSILYQNNINNFMTFILKNGVNIFSHKLDKWYQIENLNIYAKEVDIYYNKNILDVIELGLNIEDDIALTEYITIDRDLYNPTTYNLLAYMDDKRLYTRKFIKLLDS